MMGIFDAIVYGLIQGLSEFLPVSSSGHLALLPHVMRIDDPGVVFDLMMHLGTAFAVILYFWSDVKRYLKLLRPSLLDLSLKDPDRNFSRNFIFATFVSVVFIFIFLPISKYARSPVYIIFNLSFFGALLWFADFKSKSGKVVRSFSMNDSLQLGLAGLIGFAQAWAIFPGVSRSGITLTMALILGMGRTEAGKFSFLLSLPIIFAGIIKEIPDLLATHDNSSLIVLLTGVLTSFVVGYLTIKFFMGLIKSIELKYFAFYRWFIAILMWYVLF